MALGHKIIYFFKAGLAWGLILLFVINARAQEISPAHEQDFIDAQNALASAQGAQAETYSPETFKKAQDLLALANEARTQKDTVKFSQASRLARAYAEMAKATATLKAAEEKLSVTQEELRKVRAEIDQLKKGQAP